MVLPTCPGCSARDRTITRLQRQITQLQRRLAKLEADNRRLRQQLDEARRQAHRQTAPFRRRHTKLRRKKPGRRKGHPAANRPTPPPERLDRIIDVPCLRCPDCQADLLDPGVVVQYQTDLPPIVPIVTQFNIETGYCPCCRRYCQGRHTEQVSDAIGAAGNTLGPVVLTMAAELKHRLGVPYRKICDFFSTYGDLTICPAIESSPARASLVEDKKRVAAYQLLAWAEAVQQEGDGGRMRPLGLTSRRWQEARVRLCERRPKKRPKEGLQSSNISGDVSPSGGQKDASDPSRAPQKRP